MRMFWAIILVLMLAGAGVLVARRDGRALPDRAPTEMATLDAAAVEPPPDVSEVTKPDPQPPVAEPEPEPVVDADTLAVVPAPIPEPVTQTAPEPVLDAAAMDAILGIVVGENVAPVGAEPSTVAAPVPPAASNPEVVAPSASVPDGVPGAPRPATFAGYEIVPATRTARDDGAVLLDDRFVLRGLGTEADPYKVSWDLLTSSSETLAPRQGKKRLPERITMLDGKWVEVAGYIAFPLMVPEADELLLMLNQWDGCCIGIPPTPYDAVEVGLIQPVKGQDRFAVQGTLKGKLGVKPHLVGEWLVGIYVMDRATLSTKAIGGIVQ